MKKTLEIEDVDELRLCLKIAICSIDSDYIEPIQQIIEQLEPIDKWGDNN